MPIKLPVDLVEDLYLHSSVAGFVITSAAVGSEAIRPVLEAVERRAFEEIPFPDAPEEGPLPSFAQIEEHERGLAIWFDMADAEAYRTGSDPVLTTLDSMGEPGSFDINQPMERLVAILVSELRTAGVRDCAVVRYPLPLERKPIPRWVPDDAVEAPRSSPHESAVPDLPSTTSQTEADFASHAALAPESASDITTTTAAEAWAARLAMQHDAPYPGRTRVAWVSGSVASGWLRMESARRLAGTADGPSDADVLAIRFTATDPRAVFTYQRESHSVAYSQDSLLYLFDPSSGTEWVMGIYEDQTDAGFAEGRALD